MAAVVWAYHLISQERLSNKYGTNEGVGKFCPTGALPVVA